MKERPIIFSAEMVRAILEGRKTQTRRVVKGNPVRIVQFIGADDEPNGIYGFCEKYENVVNRHIKCPYGQPGDRLWVRESFGYDFDYAILYKACKYGSKPFDPSQKVLWKPSIHMPRSASRIVLEITNIRVERLQEISEADAKAEGLQYRQDWLPQYRGGDHLPWIAEFPIDAFRVLWKDINGADSWTANPWVWVIEFKAV